MYFIYSYFEYNLKAIASKLTYSHVIEFNVFFKMLHVFLIKICFYSPLQVEQLLRGDFYCDQKKYFLPFEIDTQDHFITHLHCACMAVLDPDHLSAGLYTLAPVSAQPTTC